MFTQVAAVNVDLLKVLKKVKNILSQMVVKWWLPQQLRLLIFFL